MRWASLLVLVLACGNDAGQAPPDDEPDPCETSVLDYASFGRPFMLDWCTGCHASTVPVGMRQDAPADVNFDDRDMLVEWQERILARAAGAMPTMPPAGGPSDEERALLEEWLACGMP